MSTSAKRPELPAIPRPRSEAFDPGNDDLIKQRLRDVSSPLGFGTRASPRPAPSAPVPPPMSPCKSFNLSVPDYLFDELGMLAVKRRVTKRYLILEALAKTGFTVEPQDLEEDGRRRR
jgi:hypothetical protein